MRYLIVIEKTGTGFSAFSPDLPGCIASGASESEVTENMKEAIEFHRDGLREEGQAIQAPASAAAFIEIN